MRLLMVFLKHAFLNTFLKHAYVNGVNVEGVSTVVNNRLVDQ